MFNDLVASIKACTLCAEELTAGVRPVLQVHPQARILIAGQAPGTKVHNTGIPFDDASGDRLRAWMGVDNATFYDQTKIAILPMGFCYPGKGKSGDLPPKPICATTWRDKIMTQLHNVGLTLAIGQYAQGWHLPQQQKNVTETVRAWRSYDNSLLPLPHPSPRNNIWLKKNSWFEAEVLPVLKSRVAATLNTQSRHNS